MSGQHDGRMAKTATKNLRKGDKVVTTVDLRNVPEKGLYSFEPGAFIGRYMPDTFWFDRPETKA